MLDEFDYKEPQCALCGGREFYNPKDSDTLGTIPVARIIEKVDDCYERGNLNEALRMLNYWRAEAIALRDYRGQISVNNELVGVHRKLGDETEALEIVEETLMLVDKLGIAETVSGATILLNCATDLKAFGQSERALPMYKAVEEVYLANLDAGDDMLAGLYNNYALCFVDLEMYKDAEGYYHKALEVKRAVKDGELESAITYVNLAHMYEVCADDTSVKESLDTAVRLLRTPDLPHNGYYAFVLEKCVPSLEYFGYTEDAVYFSQLAGEIYARA